MNDTIDRVGDLETRWTQNIKSKQFYPEIIKWEESCDVPRREYTEHCYTLALWKKNKEEWYLKFIGNRPFDIEIEYGDMWMLMKKTQDMLDCYVEEDDENDVDYHDWNHYGRWKIENKAESLEKTMSEEVMNDVVTDERIREIVRDEIRAVKRNEDKPF